MSQHKKHVDFWKPLSRQLLASSKHCGCKVFYNKCMMMYFHFFWFFRLIDRMRSALWIGLNSLNFNYGWQWSGGSPFRYLNWALGRGNF